VQVTSCATNVRVVNHRVAYALAGRVAMANRCLQGVPGALQHSALLRKGGEPHVWRMSRRVDLQPALLSPRGLSNPASSEKASCINDTTFQSILNCDVDIQKDLYGNIVPLGGNTVFTGIGERMSKDRTALAPSTMKIKVVAPPEQKYSVRTGGSIISF
jgi:hypothetical protein